MLDLHWNAQVKLTGTTRTVTVNYEVEVCSQRHSRTAVCTSIPWSLSPEGECMAATQLEEDF